MKAKLYQKLLRPFTGKGRVEAYFQGVLIFILLLIEQSCYHFFVWLPAIAGILQAAHCRPPLAAALRILCPEWHQAPVHLVQDVEPFLTDDSEHFLGGRHVVAGCCFNQCDPVDGKVGFYLVNVAV